MCLTVIKVKFWLECAKPGGKQFHFASVGGVVVGVTQWGWRATPVNSRFVLSICHVNSK